MRHPLPLPAPARTALTDTTAPPVRRTTEVIAELLPVAGRRILEVGCGEGALLGWLRRRGAEAIGLEVEAERLERAGAALGRAGLVAGTGAALPLATASLDGVLHHNSLHHVPVPLQTEALVEARRVLRPGGRLLVLEPLAEDEYFELVRPLEDETAVRAAAAAALARAEALAFRPVVRTRYVQLVQRRSLEELLSALVGADPARAAGLARARAPIAAAFTRLGTATAGGRSFRQPMQVVCLERPEGGIDPEVARSPAERAEALALRMAVFVDEQGVPAELEVDAFEDEAEHAVARLDGRVVGCLRWRRIGPARTAKIERVAVRPEARGRGVARTLLRWLLARLDGLGVGPLVLDAQVRAQGLYAALGFRPEGAPFVEAGIPHQRMVRAGPYATTSGPATD